MAILIADLFVSNSIWKISFDLRSKHIMFYFVDEERRMDEFWLNADADSPN